MSLVNTQMVRLAQRVDPFTKDGTELTATNIGNVAGDRFTAQRLLDCYNEARIALAQTISVLMPTRLKSVAVSGNTVRSTTSSFTSGVLTKPTGYIESIYLSSVAGLRIHILPLFSEMNTFRRESALTPIVYESATQFVSRNGNLYIPDAATYIFIYLGVTPFTLTDVYGGGSPTVQETYNPMWEPLLVQLAEAIADEQGAAAVNALAARLLETRKG